MGADRLLEPSKNNMTAAIIESDNKPIIAPPCPGVPKISRTRSTITKERTADDGGGLQSDTIQFVCKFDAWIKAFFGTCPSHVVPLAWCCWSAGGALARNFESLKRQKAAPAWERDSVKPHFFSYLCYNRPVLFPPCPFIRVGNRSKWSGILFSLFNATNCAIWVSIGEALNENRPANWMRSILSTAVANFKCHCELARGRGPTVSS